MKTKAQQDTFDLAKKVEEHIEKMKNPDYVENVKELRFPVGKKLYLEVNVEDNEMTRFLFHWLYSTNDKKETPSIFGCKLDTIHFDIPYKEQIKEQLIEHIRSFS